MLLSLLTACQRSSEEPAPPADQPSSPVQPSDQPGGSGPAEEGLSCAEIMTGVLRALYMEDSPTALYGAEDEEPERLPAYIEESYGLSEGEWVDAYVARKGKSSGMEMAVVRCADEEAAAHALECLQEYNVRRQEEVDGSKTIQKWEKALMADAILLCRGEYAAMFACYGREYAAQIFTQIMDTGEVPEPKAELDTQMDLLLAYCEAEGEDVSNVERIDSGDTDRLKSIIEEGYGLTDAPWEDAIIARGTDGSVFELAIVRFENFDTAYDYVGPMVEYLDAKEEEYARFPAQAKMLSEAGARLPLGTRYIILAVSADPWSVTLEFGQYLTDGNWGGAVSHERHWTGPSDDPAPSVEPDPNYPDRAKFAPPNEEDMSLYDTSAIRAAWETGDRLGLSDADQAVYDAAKEILGEILRDGMTDLEKEEAVYRWVVDNVNYDWSHMDILAETPRTAYEPYGALVDRMAVCLGYAAGFQLLCDLSEIECITVVGADYNGTGDHAWNMARLDGNWYCVDPTWDANNRELWGENSEWEYFNVTSDKMAESHQWDYANTPEATAEDKGA